MWSIDAKSSMFSYKWISHVHNITDPVVSKYLSKNFTFFIFGVYEYFSSNTYSWYIWKMKAKCVCTTL